MQRSMAFSSLGIAFLYLASGVIGMQFSLPPGYASPVFPPAGIALAWVLFFGRRSFPGIVLGSALMNTYVSWYVNGSTDFLLIAVVGTSIGIGACAQALFGAYLMKRWLSFPQPFRRPSSIAIFVLGVATISTLVNSLFGPVTLCLAQIVPWSALPTTGFFWWVGDTIGVMVCAPVTLALMPGVLGIRPRTSAAIAFSMLLLMALFAMVFSSQKAAVNEQITTTFESHVDDGLRDLENALTQSVLPLHAVRSYVEATPESNNEAQVAFLASDFQRIAHRYLKDYPDISALSWNVAVSAAEKEAFVKRVRQQDQRPDFAIRSDFPEGEVEDTENMIVVRFIEPAGTHDEAFGINVAANPQRRAAFMEAKSSNNVVLTAPITLVQEQEGQLGSLAILSVHSLPASAQEVPHVRGYTVAVLRYGKIFGKAMGILNENGIAASLLDASSEGNLREIAANPLTGGDKAFLTGRRELRAFGRNFVLEVSAGGDFMSSQGSSSPHTVLIGGLLFCGLLSAFLLQMASHVSQIEGVVDERTADLRAAMRNAENASRLKEAFLANMSHEIRTPLNGIVGASQLLQDFVPQGEGRQYLDMIEHSSQELLRLISDILDISKIERDQLSLLEEPVDLALVLESVRQLIEVVTTSSDNSISFDLKPSQPTWVLTDAGRIKQVLINLMNNAVKFTRHGEIALTTKVQTLDDGKIELHCEVSDTGEGIPEELQARVFEAFVRANNVVSGTGLGLAICKRLVEMMGGELTLRSAPGKGTRVSFKLPLVLCDRPDSKNEAPDARLTATPPARNACPKNVLLVEDVAVNQLIARKHLEALYPECTVKIANNGREALEVLDAMQPQLPDVILMDCQMPEMDGYETTQAIRGRGGRFLDITIIAMTANAMSDDRQRCLAVGMNDYLSKPVKREDIAEALERWLAETPAINA